MTYDNGKFRISKGMIDYLSVVELPLRHQRFLLAALHYQHLLGEWPTVDPYQKPGPEWLPLADFRKLGCATNSNDSRHFRNTADFWRKEGVLFEDVKVLDDGKHLEWEFSSFAFALMSDMSQYALFDTEHLEIAKTDMDLNVALQIALHRKLNRPQFRMFEDPIFEPGANGFVTSARKAKLRRTLKRYSEHCGYGFVVGYLQEAASPGCTSVAVRIQHASTTWPKDRIEKFPPKTRVERIAPSSGWPRQCQKTGKVG